MANVGLLKKNNNTNSTEEILTSDIEPIAIDDL